MQLLVGELEQGSEPFWFDSQVLANHVVGRAAVAQAKRKRMGLGQSAQGGLVIVGLVAGRHNYVSLAYPGPSRPVLDYLDFRCLRPTTTWIPWLRAWMNARTGELVHFGI